MTFPVLTVEFSPGTGPFGTPSWVVLGEVLDASWTWGTQRELSHFPPGEADITVRNNDRRLDPDNTSGPYFGLLSGRVPVRVRATHESVTYDLFTGFVEDGFEQTFEPPATITCSIHLVDLVAVIEGYDLPGVYESFVLDDAFVGLNSYYPLTDSASTVAVDQSGNGFDGRYRNDPELVGVDEGLVYGEPARRFGAGRRQAVIVEDAAARLSLDDGDEVALEAWFRTSAPIETGTYAPIYMQTGDSSQTTLMLYLRPNGAVALFAANSEIGANGWATSATDMNDGQVHHVQGYIDRSDPFTTFFMYLDDIEFTSFSDGGLTPVNDGSPITTAIAIGGNPVQGGADLFFDGEISHVITGSSFLGDGLNTERYQAGVSPLGGLRSDQQVEWALGRVGVPSSMYTLDAGQSIMGPAAPKDRNALEWMREVTATEQGALYVDHTLGKLRFRDRYASFQDTRATNVQFTVTDDPAATDGDLVVRTDPDGLVIEAAGVRTVINRAQVSWQGGTETSEDAASIDDYGPRSISIDTTAATPNQARSVGEWVTLRHGQPATRVRGLRINAGTCHTYFPAVLGVRVGDRIAYRSQPSAVGSVKSTPLEVLGVRHRVRGVEWTTDLYTTTAPNDDLSLFTLGSSTLGGSDVLAY